MDWLHKHHIVRFLSSDSIKRCTIANSRFVWLWLKFGHAWSSFQFFHSNRWVAYDSSNLFPPQISPFQSRAIHVDLIDQQNTCFPYKTILIADSRFACSHSRYAALLSGISHIESLGPSDEFIGNYAVGRHKPIECRHQHLQLLDQIQWHRPDQFQLSGVRQ